MTDCCVVLGEQEHAYVSCSPRRLSLSPSPSPSPSNIPQAMDLNPLSPSDHNAIAGPSSLPRNASLFLIPPGACPLIIFRFSNIFHSASPRPPQLLESTQDLISRFHLLTSYDKFVRPFIAQESDPNTALPTTPAVPHFSDKSKGKERDPGTPTVASAATPTHHDPDDDEGRDGKKKKNTYRHLIKGVPGS